MRQIDPLNRIWQHGGWTIKPNPQKPYYRNSFNEMEWIACPPSDFPIAFKISGFEELGGLHCTGLKIAKAIIDRYNELARVDSINGGI
jgi:hypothetical protein